MKRAMKTEQTPPTDRPVARPRLKRILNLRLLVETLIVAAILGPAGYGWYYYQSQRLADAMLERAKEKADEKKDFAAAEYYRQYLTMKRGGAEAERPDAWSGAPAGVRAQVLLAEAFGRATKGQPSDQAITYYYEALGVAPKDKQHSLRQGLAEALMAKRMFAQAEEELQPKDDRGRRLELDPNDAQDHRLLALALYGQSQSGSLSGGRPLSVVGEAVQHAHDLNPGDVEIARLLIDIYRNQPRLLGKGLLEAGRKKLADRELRRVEAEYKKTADKGQGLSEADRKKVADAAQRLSEDDCRRLLAKMVNEEMVAAKEQAKKQYKEAIEISPSDYRPYCCLAEIYTREGELALAADTLRSGLEKEKAGTDNIPLNRALTEVLLVKGQSDKDNLDNADKMPSGVKRTGEQSASHQPPPDKQALKRTLDADLDEADKTIAVLENTAERIAPRQSRAEKAAFQQDIDWFRGRLWVLKGRYDKAETALKRVAEGDGAEITRRTEAYLRLGQIFAAQSKWEKAAGACKKATALDPNDIRPYRLAAKVWIAADQPDKAVPDLRKAAATKVSIDESDRKYDAKLAPDDPIALGKLFFHYVQNKQTAEARETLDQVAKNENLDKVQQASLLAFGYEQLGDKKQAETNYRKAARLGVKNPAAQVQLAAYLLGTPSAANRSEAKQLLEKVHKESPDFAPARRLLAGLFVAGGGEQAWQDARRLLEETGKDGLVTDQDRHLEAIVLSRRGGKENLDKARQILETLVADPKKAADADRRLLAGLYEAAGNVEAARRQYLKLVTREKVDPADIAAYINDIAAYINFLLRHDLFDEADAELKKLPDDLSMAALRAQWLRAKGQPDKIEPLLEPLADKFVKKLPTDSRAKAKFLFDVGNLYSSLDQHKAAERWYRRLVAMQPKRYPSLVGSLAQQGRMKEALDLCHEAAKTDASALPAITAAAALLAGKPSAEDFARAEPLLSKAAADHKDDASLLSALASVRVVQQRLDEATGIFRQALALKPDDVAALNNLATLLAESPEHRKEALQHIDQAIEIAGPQPGFLDTKGMILVFENKPADAVPLLEQAAASPLADPRYHFHLAVAYDRAGQAEKARAAFHTARKNRLDRQILTPKDQMLLTELEKKFN
jgi:tetratricopeptide (TPR) repeat protein